MRLQQLITTFTSLVTYATKAIRAGLRIADVSNIANGIIEEAAYFDVYPQNDEAQFNGTWSNYLTSLLE